MAYKERLILKKIAQENYKEDKDLEAYKSLATLYIQVDESVMTRHKFFLTIVIAIFTAIGLLIYQNDECNINKAYILIIVTSYLGIAISWAWYSISQRGLYIDKIISKELEILEEYINIFPSFTLYNDALADSKGIIVPAWCNKKSFINDKLVSEDFLKPKKFQKRRMEIILIDLIKICIGVFFIVFLYYAYTFGNSESNNFSKSAKNCVPTVKSLSLEVNNMMQKEQPIPSRCLDECSIKFLYK